MLYVIFKDRITEQSFIREMHLGDKKWVKPNLIPVHIEVDGHELQAVEEQFTNLPMHNGQVVQWSGDLAAFVYNNIDL